MVTGRTSGLVLALTAATLVATGCASGGTTADTSTPRPATSAFEASPPGISPRPGRVSEKEKRLAEASALDLEDAVLEWDSFVRVDEPPLVLSRNTSITPQAFYEAMDTYFGDGNYTEPLCMWGRGILIYDSTGSVEVRYIITKVGRKEENCSPVLPYGFIIRDGEGNLLLMSDRTYLMGETRLTGDGEPCELNESELSALSADGDGNYIRWVISGSQPPGISGPEDLYDVLGVWQPRQSPMLRMAKVTEQAPVLLH